MLGGQGFSQVVLQVVGGIAQILVQREVVHILIDMVQHGGFPLGEGGHLGVGAARGHQLDGGVDGAHGPGGFQRQAAVFVGGLMADLPGAVHLVAQAPGMDAERLLGAVGDAQVAVLAAAGMVAVFQQVAGGVDAPGAQVDRHHDLGGLSARYLQDTETGAVELQLLPAGCTPPPDARRRHVDSLVQAYLTGDELPGGYSGGRTLWLHRLLSGWSMEGRLRSDLVEALGLEPSWARFGVRCLRFGQAGSMPCNGWFPWLMAEDRRAGVFWGCTLRHNASWQMEVCRQDDGLSLCGGLADSESGQWCKTLAPGETFVSPTALLTAVQTDSLDEAAAPMVEWDQNHLPPELPLVFNEYCSSWGSPSQESVERLVNAVRGHGFRYFVIDCGWYKAEGVPWDTSMGDYDVSPVLFPAGLQAATALIRGAGMVPGLWFEPETVGHDARAFGCTEHQLHRRGTVADTTLSSFSDAHECAAIPIIAANLHRAVPPAKSLVWAVLRKTDDARRLAWSLTAGLLGRLCVSGDAAELSTDQWKIVDEGLAFYRLAAPVIRRGVSRRYGPTVTSYDTPEGWQGIVRTGDAGCFVVLHRFGGADPGPITVPLPWPCQAPAAVYEVCGATLAVHGTTLTWQPAAPMSSAALYFTKEGT